MDGIQIKKLLLDRGITQQMIAKTIGQDPCTVSQVINGLRKTRKVQIAIAEYLNIPSDQIFPQPQDEKTAA